MKRALIIFAIMVISIVSLTSITAFAGVSFPKEEGIQINVLSRSSPIYYE